MAAPLEQFKGNILGFARRMTPLVLTEKEEQMLLEFQFGTRKGVGLHAWNVEGMHRCLYIMCLVVLWRTLCFEDQLTGVYGRTGRTAATFVNALSHFVSDCSPEVRTQLRWHLTEPRVTTQEVEFWRIVAFAPTENDLEPARQLLTNVIYYDFDLIPCWLIEQTQAALRGKDRTVTLALLLDRQRRPTEPLGAQWFDKHDAEDD